MARVNFIFVLHFHQPVGQLEWVYERIYNNCYKILLDLLLEYPQIKIGAHISGPLLLSMSEKHTEFIEMVKELVRKGSLEPLAGAFGEAILPIIPREDMYKHVELYMNLFSNIFGMRPRGFWLSERVWEPSVVEPLAVNGIEYTIVDDYVLPKVIGRDSSGYGWATEDGGYRLKLLFIDERIRYLLPWESPDKVVRYILGKGSDTGDRYVLWGSDAEKFGEWSDKAWARTWLRQFFEMLIQYSDAIDIVKPSEYLDRYGVRGLVYPVYGSYDKMMMWSQGYFRNFLIKYRESNYMHKRVLWLRKKLRKLNAPQDAWRYYYLAQCNDAYWHGLFGGIYITHLRQAVYENVIRAEMIAEEAAGYYTTKDVYISLEDMDFDGHDEVVVETRYLDLFIKPNDGGTIAEISFKHPRYMHNIVSTMSRYEEPYLAVSTTFRPDWYQRTCARDHLWAFGIMLWDWVNNTPFIDQSDLALGSYRVELMKENAIMLRFGGHFYGEQKPVPVDVIKHIEVDPKKPRIRVIHRVKNVGDDSFSTRIGFDYHLSPRIPRRKGEDYQLYSSMPGVFKHPEEVYIGVGRILRIVNEVPIEIRLDKDIDIWVAPIITPTRTEKGIMDILQAMAIMFSKATILNPGNAYELSIEIALEDAR